MKASFALAAAGAAVVAAQSLDSLPQCGQNCINSMLGIATNELGCEQGDVECYCREPNFGYGVRDCALEACGNNEQATTVIAYGTQYCRDALASISAGSSPVTGTGALPILTSAIAGEASNATATATTMMSTITGAAGGNNNNNNSTGAMAGGISEIDGGSSGYAIGTMTTLTAGGDATSISGTEYSALPSGAGIVVVADGSSTTLSGSEALAGAFGGALASETSRVTTDADGNTRTVLETITPSATNDSDNAEETGSNDSDDSDDVDTTVTDFVASATDDASESATDAAASATGEDSTETDDSGAGAMMTAAPGLVGAAALMMLAL